MGCDVVLHVERVCLSGMGRASHWKFFLLKIDEIWRSPKGWPMGVSFTSSLQVCAESSG